MHQVLHITVLTSFSVSCCQLALVKDGIAGHRHLAAAHQHSVRLGV